MGMTISEKIIAAHRANIRTIIIPRENGDLVPGTSEEVLITLR